MEPGEPITTEKDRLAYFPRSVASWLRSYATLRIRKLRIDEKKNAKEIRQLTKLLQLASKFKDCDAELPDLSHLISGALLKQYEMKRKRYARLYHEVYDND